MPTDLSVKTDSEGFRSLDYLGRLLSGPLDALHVLQVESVTFSQQDEPFSVSLTIDLNVRSRVDHCKVMIPSGDILAHVLGEKINKWENHKLLLSRTKELLENLLAYASRETSCLRDYYEMRKLKSLLTELRMLEL